MISKTQSSKILNALMGISDFDAPSTVYLGLCASEPDVTTGAVTNAGEPSSVASYERKKVGGTSVDTQYFGTSSQTGIISNKTEIQLKTAREDYPAKINYWFLSSGATGAAYIWGRIKDVLCDTKTVSGFMAETTYNTYVAQTTVDNLLDLQEGETYIVSWDGKEYEEIATLVEQGGASCIVLGNPYAYGGERNDIPFSVFYTVTTTGTETVGNLKIYSLTGESAHEVTIYGIGIDVKKATVPTFYEGELQARIDA